jgi:urate oxidase
MADLELEHQHGTARVRVARLWRGKRPGEAHYLAEWNVSISLISRVLAAFTDGDNSNIVATDTMKNTVLVDSFGNTLLLHSKNLLRVELYI